MFIYVEIIYRRYFINEIRYNWQFWRYLVAALVEVRGGGSVGAMQGTLEIIYNTLTESLCGAILGSSFIGLRGH